MSLAQAGVVAIIAVTKFPLANTIEITAQTVPAMPTLKHVTVGVQEDGQPWNFPLDQSHAVVGGVPGAGKSVMLRVVLAGISQRPDIQIVGIDCAGGVDFSAWSPRFSALATNQDEAIDALEALWIEHNRRIKWLLANGRTSISNAGYSNEMPLWVVVIDEAALLFRLESTNREEKAKGQRIVDQVIRLVTVSRKTGISVILATQKPTTNTMPSLVRDNAPTKVCFHVSTHAAAESVLGDKASVAPMSPTAIPFEAKGMAITEGVDGQLTVVRGFYIHEDNDRAIADRYAHLARPIPREQDGDVVDAEVEG